MTFKQLEALYWVALLGGFQPAAIKLHTTQSAVSKRVQELEALLGVPLFDRSLRAARLTDKGEELLVLAKRMLDMREEAIAQIGSSAVVEKTLRLGVTELTAMTWLPRFVGVMHRHYPKVVVEPDVDMSTRLREKLLADEIDLIIVPETQPEPRFSSVPVGMVENVWMCKPGLMEKKDGAIGIYELGAHRLLADKSGPGEVYARWFKSIGFSPRETFTSNSVIALLSLTISGFGVSYFPRSAFGTHVSAGMLQELEVTPVLPGITYMAMHKVNRHGEFMASIIRLARESCDFSATFQTGEPDLFPDDL